MVNAKNSLRRLVDSSFHVEISIPVYDEEKGETRTEDAHILCREIPTTTLLEITRDILKYVTENALIHGSIIGAKIEAVVNSKPEERVPAMYSLFGAVLPIALEILPSVPGVVEKVLLDCIVDATPEDVKRLGFVPSCAILNGVISRVDHEEARRTVAGFFSKTVVTIWPNLNKQTT